MMRNIRINTSENMDKQLRCRGNVPSVSCVECMVCIVAQPCAGPYDRGRRYGAPGRDGSVPQDVRTAVAAPHHDEYPRPTAVAWRLERSRKDLERATRDNERLRLRREREQLQREIEEPEHERER